MSRCMIQRGGGAAGSGIVGIDRLLRSPDVTRGGRGSEAGEKDRVPEVFTTQAPRAILSSRPHPPVPPRSHR